jgi:high-affinity nickel-transport protein
MPMPVRVALAFEFLVAIMLVGLGVRSLLARTRVASVSATKPMLIGMVHGLAGSAVLALLVIGTTRSALAAAVYLLCFSIGTIVGMMLVTLALTLPARMRPAWTPLLERGIRVVAGVASIAIGILLAHEVGVARGLFGATPTMPAE